MHAPNRSPCICRGFLSRPVSRILSWVAIHLGRRFPGGSSGVPGPWAGHLVTGPVSPCTGRGLASRRVTTALVGSYPTVSPLPNGVSGGAPLGGFLSVPLSVGFRRLGFPQRPALWCPDFPRAPEGPRSPGLRPNCSPPSAPALPRPRALVERLPGLHNGTHAPTRHGGAREDAPGRDRTTGR